MATVNRRAGGDGRQGSRIHEPAPRFGRRQKPRGQSIPRRKSIFYRRR